MELDLQQLTTEVCRIATEAGNFLRKERRSFSRERVVEKHAHDYVSYVDKESERLLVAQLSALLPEAGFIAEEGSAVYKNEPYCWVIDPLDGTTNYIDAAETAKLIFESHTKPPIHPGFHPPPQIPCKGGGYLPDEEISK